VQLPSPSAGGGAVLTQTKAARGALTDRCPAEAGAMPMWTSGLAVLATSGLQSDSPSSWGGRSRARSRPARARVCHVQGLIAVPADVAFEGDGVGAEARDELAARVDAHGARWLRGVLGGCEPGDRDRGGDLAGARAPRGRPRRRRGSPARSWSQASARGPKAALQRGTCARSRWPNRSAEGVSRTRTWG
jgi:hypothetical protein